MLRRRFRDHPRSRGVYVRGAFGRVRSTGSSPLARGLREERPRLSVEERIIPARAGFTGGLGSGFVIPKDHPRSRGVYVPDAGDDRHETGIIPARAGFT